MIKIDFIGFCCLKINVYYSLIIQQTDMQQFFKVPDEQARKVAIGSLPGLPYRVKKALQQVIPLFDPIRKPSKGDWLWDHEQQGQTYDAYKGQMHNEIDQKRNVIYIKPLQKQISQDFLQKLQNYSQAFFHPLKVQILPCTDQKGIDSRINEYTEKPQYNAKQILKKLQQNLKPDAFCLIAVTITDLYPKQQWNFVFGLASIRERTGVFSFARYDPRFFQVSGEYEVDYEGIFWRAAGVMVHETCHMFGMRHCIYFQCVMNGSNHDEESARKPMELCPVCLRKLQSNVKFDILQRFQKIEQFINVQKVKPNKRLASYLEVVIANIQKSIK